MNLILFEPGEVSPEGYARLAGPRAAHLLNVLRVRIGQSVRVGVLDGPPGQATVSALAERSVELNCVLDAEIPSRPRIDLLLAVPRPKVLRRLWAQLAALGVGRIILTNAERVERAYFDTHVLTPECYRPLLIEGLQQARDTRLPSVSIHRRFRVLIEDEVDALSQGSLRLVANPAAATPVAARLRSGPGRAHPGRVLLAIGPEGGWNPFELGLLEGHGFGAVGMGPRTLRTDTACLALLSLVQAGLREDA